ncbi:MAG: SDR family NAD(P)-dependent oxidoreductase, partial [Chloroflexota bacterium]
PSHPHTITPPHHHTPTPPHPPSDWQQILNTLSALYVHGVDIDWECVDQHYPRKKITLPTYPFRRQRYWIRDQDEALSGTASQNQFAQWLAAQSMAELADTVVEKGQFAAEERDAIIKAFTLLEEERLAQERMQDMQSLLYEVAWEPQQMPTVSEPQPDDINGHWLILADRGGIGERIASQLRERGATVDLIRTEQELATCLARCVNGTDGSLLLHGIVHLWGLDDEAAEDTISLMAGQKRTLNSVLQIVQACAEATLVPTYRLWIVTQGAEAVLPKEPVAFAQTTLWGVGRIIALEHGDLWGGLVDIDGDATIVNRAETVFAELLNAQPDDETQIAYRHGKRHVARFTPLQSLPKQRTPKIKIQADATYLITGGLGALGLHTTQWMATQGARHLILTGRSGIRTAEQRAIVNELDAQGITIQIAQVDVADATSMHDLFEGIRANTTNPLRGIIHIAGLSGRDAIRSLNWARFEQVLRPKVSGGWLLHHLSLEMDLDFFISYASVAGILGDRQNTHYSAANHFLDGLMTHRQSLGLPGLSIAWGPWAGGGMISADAEMRLAEIGVSSMSPEIGIDLQAYLLQTTIPQVTTIDIEHGRLNRLYELTKSRAFLSRLAQAVPETTATSSSGIPSMIVELESMPTHRRLAYIESYLQQVIAGLLVIPDMPNRNTRFTEMGLDSLMALEFRRQLESDLGQTLPITAAFDYPTVASMAAHLLDEVLGPTEQTSELT